LLRVQSSPICHAVSDCVLAVRLLQHGTTGLALACTGVHIQILAVRTVVMGETLGYTLLRTRQRNLDSLLPVWSTRAGMIGWAHACTGTQFQDSSSL